jgi:hypothetical protein
MSLVSLLCVMVVTTVPVATAEDFFLTGPNNGDKLSLGVPYSLSWSVKNLITDSLVLVLLRCPISDAKVTECTEVSRVSGIINDGSDRWNASDLSLNDGAFYAFQLLNTRTLDVATSGMFTFERQAIEVDTRWEES